MPRPRCRCRMGWKSRVEHFMPVGPGIVPTEKIILSNEEAESLRLKDYLGIEQPEAAKKMNVSQPTFHRILKIARQKVADAIVNNKFLLIKGSCGEFVNLADSDKRLFKCYECSNEWTVKKGLERPCTCPKCKSNLIRREN